MSSSRVLVLDADPALLPSRMQALSQGGYDITSVSTIEEAAKIAKQEPHELLVISVEEPELLSMLLARFPPAMSVLVITTKDIACKVAECSGTGIHSFLIRPFSTSRFKNSVKQTINRARLLKESLRSEILINLEQVNHMFAVEAKIDRFFKLVVEISAVSTRADCVSVVTKDEGTKELIIKAQLGDYKPIWEDIYKQLIKIYEPLLLTKTTQHHSSLVRLMSQAGISSLLHVPLVIKGDMLGTITHIRATNKERFTSSDLSFASILGWWSGMTLENIKLCVDSQKQYLHTRRLLDEISNAQENERKRVAIEIHDGVAQWLVGASYDIKLCSGLISEAKYDDLESALEKVSKILQRSIKELRRAIANLPIPSLEEIGLIGTIRKAAEMLNEESISCNIEVLGDLPELTLAQEKTFYWIIQESLTNIRRHSQASDVKLLIQYVDNTLSIYVNDNGKGFDPARIMKSTIPLGHMGLLGMKERAELIDGYLDIDSEPGKGTSIKFSVNFSHN